MINEINKKIDFLISKDDDLLTLIHSYEDNYKKYNFNFNLDLADIVGTLENARDEITKQLIILNNQLIDEIKKAINSIHDVKRLNDFIIYIYGNCAFTYFISNKPEIREIKNGFFKYKDLGYYDITFTNLEDAKKVIEKEMINTLNSGVLDF